MIVDITEKPSIIRRASASGVLSVPPAVVSMAHQGETKKGDLRNSATIAAMLAVKQTPMSCLLYTSPSPRDYAASRMPSSA